MDIHLGKEIEKVLRKSGMKTKDFARKINTTPRNVYSICARKEVKTDLLKVISKVLNYNFFSLYIQTIGPEYSVYTQVPMTTLVQDPLRVYSRNKVMITLELDGKPETLDESIRRLQRINNALD
ncbi:helix-turn-helix domain-containing protein [Ohtaekwangia kribbensis]|uniref:Helix-turn-helix domain-containing protein n=1 Tax=Ohtaekwangia kribbensis TaxID=688913 RepID=A0ABW3K763_9BACT